MMNNVFEHRKYLYKLLGSKCLEQLKNREYKLV